MYTKQEIILSSYREGKSQRAISRDLGISRKTVCKYLKEYDTSKSESPSKELPYTDCVSSTPKYKTPSRENSRLSAAIKEQIDTFLTDNAKKRSTGLSKQQLKKIDIYGYLKGQGHTIGYTTVCNYIRLKEKGGNAPEAFIRQFYEPGSSCEFDWGEVKLVIDGKLTRFQLAVFTSSFSNYRYAQLYNKQDTMAFMESHVRFFSHTKGSFKEMVYDNMRVAVSKFVGKYHKEPTQALLNLRSHYLFSHRFCNARRGNEKGHVERSVEYIRRKSFALKDSFADLESAQSHLLTTLQVLNSTKQQATSKTAIELFEKEKEHLHPCTQALECAEAIELRADKYATISYKGNRYSVPETLVGKFVWVKRFSNRLEVYHKDTHVLLAKHDLYCGAHGWTIDIAHYLETFKRKPGALANSVALISNAYLREIYSAHFKESPRDFIALLSYLKTNKISNEDLKDTLERLTKTCKTITIEALKVLLGNTQQPLVANSIIHDTTTDLAKQQLAQISALLN